MGELVIVRGQALIGLGNMGAAMAQNIMAAGLPLRGYDLNEEALARFAASGGQVGQSPFDAAQGCDLVLIMVQNAAQAEAVLFGAGGAAAALPRGAVVMLCSTVAPREARAIARSLDDLGILMLDAPVSGGMAGAIAGTLTVMASGPEAAFEHARDVLSAVAGVVHDLGRSAGIGASYKVVHQLAAGVHLAAAAELLSLGKAAGCDPARLFEIVSQAAGRSWMMQDRGPRMLQDTPQVTSSVDIFVKDVGIVRQLARDAGAYTPLAEAALAMFEKASVMGHGREDDSLVIRAYDAAQEIPRATHTARAGDAPSED